MSQTWCARGCVGILIGTQSAPETCPPRQVTTIERTELDRSQREEELRVLSTEVKEVEANCAQTQVRPPVWDWKGFWEVST